MQAVVEVLRGMHEYKISVTDPTSRGLSGAWVLRRDRPPPELGDVVTVRWREEEAALIGVAELRVRITAAHPDGTFTAEPAE
jgi:hypothetical protein